MGKPFKDFLPWNNFNETWYVASGPSKFIKILPWVKLDQFVGKVKFCTLGFHIEKCDSDGFLKFLKPLTSKLVDILI